MYSFAAYAADSNPPTTTNPPGDTGAAEPAHAPKSEGSKGAYVGKASSICDVVSGDFCLGMGCAFMLVVGGIVINRS